MKHIVTLTALLLASPALGQAANGPRFKADGSITSPSGSYNIDGTTGAATFGSLALPPSITGTLPITNGGTEATSATSATTNIEFLSTETGAVARSVTSKLQDVVNARDFGALCNGVADDTAAISAAVASGKKVILPVGTCVVSGGITLAAQGQIIQGQGKKLTVISVPMSFSGAGVFISQNYAPASSGREGPQFRDFKITFSQPDTTNRSSLRTYPPAFYLQNSPRFQISNVLVSQATTIIDMRGDSGGAMIDGLEGSSWSAGILIDGSTDTVYITRYHFWPFDITKSQYSIWNDGTQVALQSARMDDLRLVNDFAYFSSWKFISSTNGSTFGVISGGDLDSGSSIQISAGAMYASSLIISAFSSSSQAIVNTGGTFQCSSCSFFTGFATTSPLIQQSGSNATTSIENSRLQFTGDMTLVSSSGTSNLLIMIGNTIVAPVNQTNASPVVNNGSGSRITFIGNRISDIGTGNGNLLSVSADDAHVISANSFTGWGLTLPASHNLLTILQSGNVGVGGTAAVNVLQGTTTLKDFTNSKASLTIEAPNNNSGSSVKLVGNGSTTPNKTIRSIDGNLEVVNSANSTTIFSLNDVGGLTLLGGLVVGKFTVSALPTCNSGVVGEILSVTDAASPTYNGLLSGGGSSTVIAFCNGTAWTAH